MPVELFGISIGRAKKEALATQQPIEKKASSFVTPDLDDALPVDAGGYFGVGIDLDGSLRSNHNSLQNIEKWLCTQKWSKPLKIFVMKRSCTARQKDIQSL